MSTTNLIHLSELHPDDQMSTTTIYGLVDPTTGIVRYVGKANNPELRLSGHLAEARRGKTDRKNRWIAKLLREELVPSLVVLEVCSYAVWKERECYWIEFYRAETGMLTNSKNGGDGHDPSPETRKKISEAGRGRTAHNKGKETPPEQRLTQSHSAKKRWQNATPEERQIRLDRLRLGERRSGSTGQRHTDETRARIAEAVRNRPPMSQETRDKISAAAKSRQHKKLGPCPVERRAKICLARASLSPEQVREVRALIAQKTMTQRSIAARFGVSEQVVSRIKRGESFRYV